jgi:hypothetical protein
VVAVVALLLLVQMLLQELAQETAALAHHPA